MMNGENVREKKKKKKQDDKNSKKTAGNDERKKPAKKKKKKTTKEKDEAQRDRRNDLRDGDGAISSSKSPRRATSFSTSSFHSFESRTTTSSDRASFESSSSEEESSNMISRQIDTFNGNFSSISQSPSTSSAAVAVSKEKQQQPSSTTKSSSTTTTPRVKTRPTPSFLLNRTGSLPIETESIEEDSPSKRKGIRRNQRTIQRSKSADFDFLLEDSMISSPSHSDSVNNRSSKTNITRRKFSTPKRSKSGDFDILDDNKSSNNNKMLSKPLYSSNIDQKSKPSWLSSNKKKKPPTDGAFIVTRANRRIVSLDVDPNDPNWRWKVFPEPTSIEYLTSEIDDEIADEVYSSRHYIRKPPTKPRRPGISGYDFYTILAEENENEPQPPTTLGGGVFGDYLAERQKLARWQARWASREKMSIRIQTLVRRFLARLEYLERVRLKGLEQMKQRIRELGRLVDQINESRIAALRNLNVEFEKRRVKERESLFENFKLRGRKEMLETRKMVAMKPQLHPQSKALKSERHEMKTRIEKISVQNKKIKTKNDKLQIESDQLEKLVHQQSKLLAETNHLCSIESTLRAVYENGLNRTLGQIRKATPDDVDLLDSIDDMAKFCEQTIEPQRTNEPCPLAT